MKAIHQLILPPALPTQQTKPVPGLLLGEILAARVHAKISSNHYQLRIRDTLLQVKSNQPLNQGQILHLRVSQLNDPVTLKIVNPATADIENSESATLQQAKQVLVRESLPRARPLLPLFRYLFASSGEALQVPSAAQNTIKTLRQLVQSYRDLNRPAEVKQAMESSGLFLESRIARHLQGGNSESPPMDIKLLLLKLARQLGRQTVVMKAASQNKPMQNGGTTHGQSATIAVSASAKNQVTKDTAFVKNGNGRARNETLNRGQQTPAAQSENARGQYNAGGESRTVSTGDLRQMVDGALARIQLHQNQAAVSDANSQPVWSAEIPVYNGKDIQSIGLTIAKDSRTDHEEQQRGWTITLHLDLDHMGTVQVRMGLYGERISASIWAACSETAELFESHLEQLQRQLQRAGLQVDKLHCLQGNPPPGTETRVENLLDVML